MRKHIAQFLLLFVLLSCGRPPVAEEKPAPQIPVANKKELSEAVGQDVSIVGKVSRTGKSSSGHVFLNFAANSQFTIFIPKTVVAQFREDDPQKSFQGETVLVRGKVERYQNKLQIRLASPKQITITKPQEPARPQPVKLKSLGDNAWVSPAGVRYVGRDPEGRTRKEHVLRHAKDLPDREGPHGVFDEGESLTFAWIDEAWKTIQANRIRPQTEGDRETYTVPMGRRVGYLGGKTGAKQNHPPLTKIFLVVRKGTSEVITAFPK